MEFSLDENSVHHCASSREDQEIAVLKHLRIVYTEMILDLVIRKAALNGVREKDKMFCSKNV